MTIFIGHSLATNRALRVAATRRTVRQLARRIYSDDFERDPETQIRENLLGILGRLLPEWHLSHSSAVTLAPVAGHVFLSGAVRNYRHLDLPGVVVIRLPDLPHPELEWIEAPTLIGTTPGTDRQVVRVSLSSPLQAVFECLRPARRYKEKQLPQQKLVELLGDLAAADRARAESFAIRNGLRSELDRFVALAEAADADKSVVVRRPNRLDVYFYGWKVGTLSALGTREFRFEYAPGWQVELSPGLPLTTEFGPSYEGLRLPAFFENLLPEGWTEGWIRAAHKIARDDAFGLLTTTPKYLSNITVRPAEFAADELVFDAHSLRLENIWPREHGLVTVRDEITEDPDSRELWLALRNQGGVRLSGIQPKLPVSLGTSPRSPVLRLGGWKNACGHILKLESAVFPNLVQIEWATMELARRAGLTTPEIRMVEFMPESKLRGRALLVERFDIPTKKSLEGVEAGLKLALLEDACSLLQLHRHEKYDVSLERVATALGQAALSAEYPEGGLWDFLKHVLFSWIVGNGDLHTKNIAVLKWLAPGRLGSAPTALQVEYSPLYDLLNTRLPLPGDQFALTLNGRRDRLRLNDFVALAARWGGPQDAVLEIATQMCTVVREQLADVLDASGLDNEVRDGYTRVVDGSIAGFRF